MREKRNWPIFCVRRLLGGDEWQRHFHLIGQITRKRIRTADRCVSRLSGKTPAYAELPDNGILLVTTVQYCAYFTITTVTIMKVKVKGLWLSKWNGPPGRAETVFSRRSGGTKNENGSGMRKWKSRKIDRSGSSESELRRDGVCQRREQTAAPKAITKDLLT